MKKEEQMCHCQRTDRLHRIDSTYKNHSFDVCCNPPYCFEESESQRNIPLGGSVEGNMETKQNWEIEFDEKYCNFEFATTISKPEMYKLKSFISHERHLAQQEILQEIIESEKGKFIKPNPKRDRGNVDIGWNNKIDDTISLLEELKKGSKL